MKKKYEVFYTDITEWFRKSDKRRKALVTGNQCLTWLFYLAYPLVLILIFFRRRSFFVRALLVPAVSFVILSLIRQKINRPRPYEQWQIDPLIHKNTKGKSMPSRHLFSSAVIAMVFLYLNPVWGVVFLILSALDGVLRVIGGVHYPSDVITGFLCGCLAGCFLWV